MFGRSPSHRLSSTVLGAWFALFTMAPASWRPCPVHGPGEAAGHSPMQAAAPASHVGAMAGMQCAHTRVVPPATPPRRGAPVAPHRCDCPPGCGCIAAIALVHQPLQLGQTPLRVEERPALAPVQRDVPSRERLLPFANGPPVVAAG
ncbi:MAG: hypothetical protein ACYC3L_09005 [Gemmatimonadaceae bacterium]